MNSTRSGIGSYLRTKSPNAAGLDWSGLDAVNRANEAVRQEKAAKLARQVAEIADLYETVKAAGRIHCVRRGQPDDWAIVAVLVRSDQCGQWVQAEARTSDACPYPAEAFAVMVRRTTEKALEDREEAKRLAREAVAA